MDKIIVVQSRTDFQPVIVREGEHITFRHTIAMMSQDTNMHFVLETSQTFVNQEGVLTAVGNSYVSRMEMLK